jgi:hypothetical protein
MMNASTCLTNVSQNRLKAMSLLSPAAIATSPSVRVFRLIKTVMAMTGTLDATQLMIQKVTAAIMSSQYPCVPTVSGYEWSTWSNQCMASTKRLCTILVKRSVFKQNRSGTKPSSAYDFGSNKSPQTLIPGPIKE